MKNYVESKLRKLKGKRRLKSLKKKLESTSLGELAANLRGSGKGSTSQLHTALGKHRTPYRVNLCSGELPVPGFINIDVSFNADITVDLEKSLIPLPDNSVEHLACISAINYFDRERAQEIIADVWRVLRPGGVARFATQDLRVLSQKYLEGDKDFYFRLMKNGRIRFPGETSADKFMHFYYGFAVPGMKHKRSKYIFDFETLSLLFQRAGFRIVENKKYLESAIPGIDKIDNRPEQMFFLEARKDDPAILLKEAADWESKGDIERAWQLWTHCLNVDPGNSTAFEKLSSRISPDKDSASLQRLCNLMLKGNPAHVQAQKLLATLAGLPVDPSVKLPPFKPSDTIADDRTALDACVNWIFHAQDATGDGGVSSMFDAQKKQWLGSFPETTGYIIPTLLAYHRLTGSGEALARARRMADWELSIQMPNGAIGEAVGTYLPFPRVFNNSQVLFGLVAMYRATKEEKYLESASRLAHHIAVSCDSDGGFRFLQDGGAHSYDARCAWALLEFCSLKPDPFIFETALRNIDWVIRQCNTKGWFWENSFDYPTKPITHLTAYAHVGLLECYFQLKGPAHDHGWLLQPLLNAADHLSGWYEKHRDQQPFLGLPGRFNPDWKSKESWSCNTGNAQYSYFFRRLFQEAANSRYQKMADSLLDDLKRVQILAPEAPADILGGIWGSSPPSGDYCPYQVNNWGVKFYADALLAKIATPEDLACIG